MKYCTLAMVRNHSGLYILIKACQRLAHRLADERLWVFIGLNVFRKVRYDVLLMRAQNCVQCILLDSKHQNFS